MAFNYAPTKFRSIKYVEETSFETGTPSTNFKAFDIEFAPDINMITPMYQKAQAGIGPDTAIVAGKGGTLTFKTYMRGGAGAESGFSKFAKYMGLHRDASAASANVAAGSTSSTLVFDGAGDIATYTTGDGVLVYGAGAALQMRWVSNKNTATLTIEPNWTDTPAENDAVYAVDTFLPYDSSGVIGEPTKYLAFRVADGIDQYWTLNGCAGTWKLATTTANSLPIIEWTYQVSTWTRTGSSGAAVFADTYDPPVALLGDPCYIDNSELYIKSIAFDPGTKLVPIESTSGTNGRSGWVYVGGEPKLEVEFLFEPTYFDYWSSGTTFQFAFTSLDDTNEAWGLYVPKLQILKPGIGDMDGLMSLKPEFQICDPGLDGSAQIPSWSLTVTGSGT